MYELSSSFRPYEVSVGVEHRSEDVLTGLRAISLVALVMMLGEELEGVVLAAAPDDVSLLENPSQRLHRHALELGDVRHRVASWRLQHILRVLRKRLKILDVLLLLLNLKVTLADCSLRDGERLAEDGLLVILLCDRDVAASLADLWEDFGSNPVLELTSLWELGRENESIKARFVDDGCLRLRQIPVLGMCLCHNFDLVFIFHMNHYSFTSITVSQSRSHILAHESDLSVRHFHCSERAELLMIENLNLCVHNRIEARRGKELSNSADVLSFDAAKLGG